MKNILLVIEYDGTNYYGWQVQRPQFKTVQATVQSILRQILQEEVLLIGASRTDSGVHAKAQAANFRTKSTLSLKKIKSALNSLLPSDIVIKQAKTVNLDFHAQFNAKFKTYRYSILNRDFGSVFLGRFVHQIKHPLNLRLMSREAKSLVGRHNFSSFQGSNRIARSPVRTVKNIRVEKRGNFISIEITADGFLNNMVRNIAGTLIEFGRGSFTGMSMRKILLARNRKAAGPCAPAKGLCLMKVGYS